MFIFFYLSVDDKCYFLVIILSNPEDPDSRNLIFATQTLVKRVEKYSSGSNSKDKSNTPDVSTKWVSRVQLKKIRLTKDIRKINT